MTHRHPDSGPSPSASIPSASPPEREAERHRHAYFPFGAGPRACIGQYFSMLEATIVLATIVRAYDVSSPDARRSRSRPGITLHPDAPVPCTLTARREQPALDAVQALGPVLADQHELAGLHAGALVAA